MQRELLEDIKVLIVEDDKFNRILIKSLLLKLGNITPFEAKNGLEALAILDAEPMDICLLDLHMPVLNGFETLKIIRGGTLFENIPVIVTTSDEMEKKKSLQLGADDFIAKPFNLEKFKNKIYQQLV
jgi:CheY-like chemotaxis protein